MRFSSALISFFSSLTTTSAATAMEEPYDSVLHDVTASILEESIKVKYKNKQSHLESLKIQKSIDGSTNKANDVELADDKGDIMQKKEMLHHLVDHEQHQEGKSFEECNIYPTTTTNATATAATAATAPATAAAAAATSDDDSLINRKISLDKESIKNMDYGQLNRGTCSSPNDACVPQNKAIEGNGAFFKPEDTSYASSGYCVPLSVLEDMGYKNVVATTLSLIDKEEFNKEKEITDSYYHYHPQYNHHHRQLDLLNCTSSCPGTRLDVSNYLNYDGPYPYPFAFLLYNCNINGFCPPDYYNYDPSIYYPIRCWNTTGITDMRYAFDQEYTYPQINVFNDPLECWDVGQVTSMNQMFASSPFNQPIDAWDVSQVEDMFRMFSGANNFNQPLDTWDVSKVEDMRTMFSSARNFNQPIDTWDVSKVEDMRTMFTGARNFNQCLSTWAEKTSDTVDTTSMLSSTDCPNGIDKPNATIGPWCQNYRQGCFAPGFEPSQQPSDLPSDSPTIKSQKKKTDVPTKPPTNAPTNSPTTKSQKKKSIKKKKKQVKKKSKKM